MSAIRNVQLELLRSGPAHNQLLSPLTPYVALCGSAGPVTVHMPFEHRQLLTRLERLRYGTTAAPISASQREAEIREMGEAVGRLFGQVPALLTELSNAGEEQTRLVNLRLSISAYELGLVPFETAVGPDGVPGSGSPLQLRSLIAITREIRRGQQLPVEWNRQPRILFAFASPPGLPQVPAQAHLVALRRAIEPWVKIADKDTERIGDVKAMLTVLPNATLEMIRDACRSTEYTHVHILAHGAPFTEAGNQRYGVALCSDSDPSQYSVVDGERLAIALKGWDSSGRAKKPPTVVTLATCDSGNVSSVMIPGGSIAHELHTEGIPWVIASQFPLWMRASSIACEVLYSGLLSGADPRWVLHELRQRLRTDVPETHDWASIVAYATIAPDLEAQVEAFRDRQIRRRMDVLFGRIDDLVGANAPTAAEAHRVFDAPGAGAGATGRATLSAAAKDELKALCASIRASLTDWSAELTATNNPKQFAERLGISAASEKRIAIAYGLAKTDPSDKDQKAYEAASKEAYQRARDFYRAALEADPVNHWVITQYLSIAAIPPLTNDAGLDGLSREYGQWWAAARQIATWQLRHAERGDRAWALATLAELEMLGVVYGTAFDKAQAAQEIVRLCEQIRELVPPDSFAIFSTMRQFKRYTGYWARDKWAGLANGAIAALGGTPEI